MYNLSYEKCVCFIFLVMVAVLSCSGFRIDRLAMTDISKRNSYTSTSLNSHSDFLSRLIQSNNSNISHPKKNLFTPETHRTSHFAPETSYPTKKKYRHRIRHSKKFLRQQAQASQFEPIPTSRIDTIIYPPNEFSSSTSKTSEQFAQIPKSNLTPLQPTAPIVTRSQRSPNKNKQRNKPTCQEQNVVRKAYLANTVVLAKAESMSSNRVRNYSVSFKILKRYKSQQFAVDDNLRLTFLNNTKHMNCESELDSHHGIVKAQIQQSKEYYLFLNSHGNHNYSVFGMPVVKRKKNRDLDRLIQKVTSPNFVPKLKKPILNVTANNLQPKSKLRLECKVKGNPIPVISWRKNESLLHRNNNTRITYSNKGRKSTLVIKNAQERDSGRYQCVAKGVNGNETTAYEDIQISNSNKHGDVCSKPYRTDYCHNGGTCFFLAGLEEYSCVCPVGYSGKRCETKEISLNISSMYPQCIFGLPAYYC